MRVNEKGYGKDSEAVDYWVNHRSKISELYPSERHFFVPTVQKVASVLDIGCAAGGSALFCREINPQLKYGGIDISPELIEAAKKRFAGDPKTSFDLFDGHKIPLKNDEVEFAFAFGVFHHVNHWENLLLEALRVSSKYVLIDLRIWEQETIIDSKSSYQKLALSGHWDGESIIPYNLICKKDFEKLATKLASQNIKVSAYAYWQKPTHLAVTPAEKVLMTSILLEKNQTGFSFEITENSS